MSSGRPLSVCSLGYTEYEQDGRLRRMCESLAADGHEIRAVVLPPRGDQSPQATLRGVELHRIVMPRHRGAAQGYFGSYFQFLTRAARRLAELHRKHHFDVIHVNTMPDFMVFAALVPKLRGCAVLLDFHDMMPELYADKFGPDHRAAIAGLRVVERTSARFADHILAVHELHKQRLAANGIPAEKISVIMNVPDESIFRPRPRQARDPKTFVLSYHGTITPRHGVDLAVRAFARARAQRPFMRFKIIGHGDGIQQVRDAIREERVEDAVDFTDHFVPVHELPKQIEGASVGIISMRSSDATEMMLPVKLLEYSRIGIPVIAPRTRVISHYFKDDDLCYSNPLDIEGTAKLLVRLNDDPAYYARHVESQAKIVDAHSWSQQRQVYAGVLHQLAQR